MTWHILSSLLCLALVIKLTFFTDEHRRQSRFIYRVTLLLVTVYAFDQWIDVLYYPFKPVSPLLTVVNLSLLAGSFVLKPHHLPWNLKHEPVRQAVAPDHPANPRLQQRLLRAASRSRTAQR